MKARYSLPHLLHLFNWSARIRTPCINYHQVENCYRKKSKNCRTVAVHPGKTKPTKTFRKYSSHRVLFFFKLLLKIEFHIYSVPHACIYILPATQAATHIYINIFLKLCMPASIQFLRPTHIPMLFFCCAFYHLIFC